jgi:hypothetical protein
LLSPDPHNQQSNTQYQFLSNFYSQTLTNNTVTFSISSSLHCHP